MSRQHQVAQVTIDARPRGASGPAAEVVLFGKPMLAYLIDWATTLSNTAPLQVHTRLEEQDQLQHLIAATPTKAPIHFITGPPPEGTSILRSDRFYDLKRLRRAVRKGRGLENAVIWRLDSPDRIDSAESALLRQHHYQPIGRWWIVGLANGLVRLLTPSSVRPNLLTALSFTAMCIASGLVLYSNVVPGTRFGIAIAIVFAFLFDVADGRLARAQGTTTPIGRWLDTVLDEAGEMLLYGSIALVTYTTTADPVWLALGMAYGMGKYIFVLSNDEWNRATGLREETPTKKAWEDAAISWRSLTWWGRRLGHADLRWHLAIIGAFIGQLDWLLAAFGLYFPVRAVAGAFRKVARYG